MNGWPPLANFLLGLATAPVASYVWRIIFRLVGFRRSSVMQAWLTGCMAGGTAALIHHQWAYASGAAVSAAVAVAVWWWRRRKDRKRALAALGAKAKSRIAAMKQAMRERAKPRPVFRPVPQGAR